MSLYELSTRRVVRVGDQESVLYDIQLAGVATWVCLLNDGKPRLEAPNI